MITKLIMRMMPIQTGRRLMLFSMALIMLHGCWFFQWDYCGPHRYKIQFGNETNDTIDLLLIPHDHSESITLFPDSLVLHAEFCLDEDEDPFIDGVFSELDNAWWDEISIRWNDTMLHTWNGPYGTVPDTIRSFFNENSWELVESEEGLEGHWDIRFIIKESDIVDNQEN